MTKKEKLREKIYLAVKITNKIKSKNLILAFFVQKILYEKIIKVS